MIVKSNIWLTLKRAECRKTTFWMTETLESHNFFIRTPFCTKSLGLGPKSSLVYVIKISNPYNEVWINGMHFSDSSLVLDIFSFVKFRAVFTIAGPLFAQRNFSHGFFLFKDATEMKVNNILIGDFFIAISLMVAFSLQSENDEIMWSFLSINTLWSRNLWSLMTQNLTHMMFNMSTTRLYGWDLDNTLLPPPMTMFLRMCSFYYKWVKPFRG